jgi:hypothetical protein
MESIFFHPPLTVQSPLYLAANTPYENIRKSSIQPHEQTRYPARNSCTAYPWYSLGMAIQPDNRPISLEHVPLAMFLDVIPHEIPYEL